MPTPRKDILAKRELAEFYYLQGELQKTISERIGISETSISKWVIKYGWEAKRAARNITRPELINKLLLSINKMLDQVLEDDKSADFSGLSDKLSKLAAAIEKLDKKANIVDVIEVFLSFSKWMQHRQQIDPELTPDIVKLINRYQDVYVTENLR